MPSAVPQRKEKKRRKNRKNTSYCRNHFLGQKDREIYIERASK
jgi:hypothetical protein